MRSPKCNRRKHSNWFAISFRIVLLDAQILRRPVVRSFTVSSPSAALDQWTMVFHKFYFFQFRFTFQHFTQHLIFGFTLQMYIVLWAFPPDVILSSPLHHEQQWHVPGGPSIFHYLFGPQKAPSCQNCIETHSLKFRSGHSECFVSCGARSSVGFGIRAGIEFAFRFHSLAGPPRRPTELHFGKPWQHGASTGHWLTGTLVKLQQCPFLYRF